MGKTIEEAMRRAEEVNKKMIANRIANPADVPPSAKMEEYITELDTLIRELRSLFEFIERAKRYKSDYNQQIESARRTGDKAKADYYHQNVMKFKNRLTLGRHVLKKFRKRSCGSNRDRRRRENERTL